MAKRTSTLSPSRSSSWLVSRAPSRITRTAPGRTSRRASRSATRRTSATSTIAVGWAQAGGDDHGHEATRARPARRAGPGRVAARSPSAAARHRNRPRTTWGSQRGVCCQMAAPAPPRTRTAARVRPRAAVTLVASRRRPVSPPDQRPGHPPAVQREPGQQVEAGHHQVAHEQPGQQVAGGPGDRPAGQAEQAGQDHRGQRPGHRDQGLAAGVGRLAGDPGHPAEHEQADLGRRHPDGPGHQGVGQLVDQHAGEEGDREQRPTAAPRPARWPPAPTAPGSGARPRPARRTTTGPGAPGPRAPGPARARPTGAPPGVPGPLRRVTRRAGRGLWPRRWRRRRSRPSRPRG